MSPSRCGIASRIAHLFLALLQAEELDPVAPLSPVSDGFRRPVGGAVVDDDDLLVESQGGNALEEVRDGGSLVVGRYDEGDAHVYLRGAAPSRSRAPPATKYRTRFMA